jgi:PAT family beta-lactamase induction signal transducer AmpG
MNLSDQNTDASWQETAKSFLHPRVVTMLFFGFSAGIPILLIFSSLSLWLREAGVERSVVTFFSWAALGYSFKFVWAPLVDSLPLPFLTRALGRRRSWILLSQVLVITSILIMSSTDPSVHRDNLTFLAVAAVLLGFSSATQDIVIDAYRIESAGSRLQAMMSSSYIAGYRIGMLVAGAGALYLAEGFGSTVDHYSYQAWRMAYLIMAGCMFIGIATTLSVSEPQVDRAPENTDNLQRLQIILLFLCCVVAFIGSYYFSAELSNEIKLVITTMFDNRALSSLLVEFLRLVCAITVSFLVAKTLIVLNLVPRPLLMQLYIKPVHDFFDRYGLRFAILLLALIGSYRISDIVLGVISNVFYQDIGYSKSEIATASKLFGLWMTLIGGFLGGIFAMRIGVVRVLLIGAVLSAATNLLFILLSNQGYSVSLLYLVIGIDNLSAGFASAGFIAFLSALTNVKFSAMQYAIFSSLMTLVPKVLGGYSGGIVDSLGYSQFFTITAILGLPVIGIIILVSRKAKFNIPS